MSTYIYNDNLELVIALNYDYEQMINDPKMFFPSWHSNYYISSKKLKNPIVDHESNLIREMTREEQIILNNKYELLEDGEKIDNEQIIKISPSKDIFEPKWNKDNNKWEEGIKKNDFFTIIDRIKAEVMASGYEWKGHRQKCRDKDIGLMSSTISALRDFIEVYKKEFSLNWYFEDNDGVAMSLADMIDLRITGLAFVQSVYTTENIFKTGNIRFIDKEIYLETCAKVQEQIKQRMLGGK